MAELAHRMRTLMLAGILAGLAVLAPPAAAHEGYAAAGIATKGDEVVKILVSREFDVTGLFFRVTLSDLATAEVLLTVRFAGVDNYNAEDALLFVSHEYEADSAEPSVDFHLEGAQVSETVTGRGAFMGYDFAVGPSLV